MNNSQSRISSFVLFLVTLAFSNLCDAKEVSFARDVLPILSDRCFQCHGPDAANRESELRLDREQSAKGDIDGKRAVVPLKPDESELMRRIMSDDADVRMPPSTANRKALTKQEIATLRAWIAQGAKWSEHWAFVKPTRPKIPVVKEAAIDALIRAKLESLGLSPSPTADRRTLIRRLTLDLTGFPPTPAEVHAFLNDRSPKAYEKVVDRLLASKHYGERMAWPWLDAARYADTGGYQGDPDRSMWPWRDWLVNALNQNMPFDQFTIEQIAGDQLPNPTPEQRLATGFNRNHMHNAEGGRIAEETRVENVFDRVETTGTVWLGLTLQCARCHDHKFDPTSNNDYFSFFDFFNQTSEEGKTDRSIAVPPSITYVTPKARRGVEQLDARLSAVRKKLLAPNQSIDAGQAKWEASARKLLLERWQAFKPVSYKSHEGATINRVGENKLHVTGKRPEKDVYEIDIQTDLQRINGLRLDAYVDPKSPAKGTGRDERGNFVLTEFELFVKPRGTDEELQRVKLTKAVADYAQGALVAKNAIDGKPAGLGWAVAGHQIKKPRWLEVYPEKPLDSKSGFELKIKLRFLSEHTHHTLALFRISSTDVAQLDERDQAVAAILAKSPKARSAAENDRLREHFRHHHTTKFKELLAERDALARQRKDMAGKAKGTKVMVMDTRSKPRDTYVLVKGIYNNRTDRKVIAAVPTMLKQLNTAGRRANRLDLAKWLVSRDNPLTARVTVNRYWQTFFGRGLVSTPDDFGLQGQQPSHPKLLDWLAVEFMDSGWNVKHMHKLIVMSETYRQSARVTPEMLDRDPANTWLARSPRFRLPSWMLRDQALAASGLLVPTLGGAPVRPYQPDGIWEEATFGKKKYQTSSGTSLYRRSIYTFWRRIIGPTMFFDAAKRQTCEVKPNLTNTPLHALTTLNDVTYVEAARALAQNVMKEKKTAEHRIALAFETVTSREPQPLELELLLKSWQSYVDEFKANPKHAADLLSVGASEPNKLLPAEELAAFTATINTILNLDEALVRP